MNAHVMARMSAQWGLITRTQAREAGLSDHTIDRWVRTGFWVAVRRGVYAESSYVALLTTHHQRRLLADRAASLRVAAPHTMSHHSAAHVLRLGVLHERDPTTHITRPGIVGSHLRHGVKHHLAPHRPDQVLIVGGVPVLDGPRTALDIGRECGYLQGLVAADSALRMGATRADFESALFEMWCWPYSTVLRDIIASMSAHADSVAETLGRDLVEDLGYGRPQLQFGLTADGQTAWCDLRLGRHFFEIDGFIKLLPFERGGVATAPPDEVLKSAKLRQDFVTSFKTGVSHLTWEDFFGRQRHLALDRCRREYLDTCSRFGTDISDLAQFRPRRARPRPAVRQEPLLPRWMP
ncbi:type IV toxin-antitoxin system AbiEi family antitoxin domain-containing protein [Nocardioides sp. Root190]|uniref:type IV toxin-antitoxin system AbiEi family antitoxin domain-containing protein n=1 Tax=Nocardioides sp. Root190 TaxID=1736488 RepID=UPI0009E81802|nr:type IV toxin-antitoxin system AbiEi family antitoxin domain-containing protein [Nocardioides sp. Root190]